MPDDAPIPPAHSLSALINRMLDQAYVAGQMDAQAKDDERLRRLSRTVFASARQLGDEVCAIIQPDVQVRHDAEPVPVSPRQQVEKEKEPTTKTRPEDWLNQVCAALGLFDGARPVSPQQVLWDEVLPMIEALKTNHPEAGILVRENERLQRLWRDALAKMAEANRQADGALRRWRECEDDRQSLLRRLKATTKCEEPQEPTVLKSVQSLDGKLLAKFYDYAYFEEVQKALSRQEPTP